MREFLEELAREDPLLEPVSDVGQDVLAHELSHRVANSPLFVVEERVDRQEVEWVESRDAVVVVAMRHILETATSAQILITLFD